MRKNGLLMALLVLASGAAFAQQELAPSTDDGPLNIKPLSSKPDKDGVYQIGSGVTSPEIVRPVPAAYPPDTVGTDVPHAVIVSAVIGVDGAAKNIRVTNLRSSVYDDYAIAAVKQSQFQPGTLNGNPVPVWVSVRVRFFHLRPAIPMLRAAPGVGGFGPFGQDASASQDDPLKLRPGDTPPKAIHTPEAEFSDEARRGKFEGVVIVSLVVTEEGLPADLRLVRSAGHGLDEKALEAVSQYRFQPAMRNGQPVAVRISVEISFRLGRGGAGQSR
jgi:TonB family protein